MAQFQCKVKTVKSQGLSWDEIPPWYRSCGGETLEEFKDSVVWLMHEYPDIQATELRINEFGSPQGYYFSVKTGEEIEHVEI